MQTIEKECRFTLKTKDGCKRLLALFIAIMLVSSFIACVISSDGGNVKVSAITFDSRGGTIDADLYIPAGTSDKDSLPAVLVSHGRGVTKGVMRGIAEEIARRGFVVLNVNAYGSGLSEQPVNDEGSQGVDGYSIDKTPQGMLDALDYVRSLHYVDTKRIGMIGHSGGSRRTGFAAIMDCGYYSFNDIMINVLCDKFGLTFSKDEINQDVTDLAKAKLNADQLKYYTSLQESYRKSYDTMLKAICLVGSNANLVGPSKVVTVAGQEVERTCKVNIGIINGTFDEAYAQYFKMDTSKAAWYTGSADISPRTWYYLDDVNKKSATLGELKNASVASDSKLKEAIESRSARVYMLNKETHSKNFFSISTTADIVKYFEQTLQYNRGNLSDSSTKPLDASNIVFMWRALFNCIAMLSMLALIFPLVGLLTKEKFYEGCIVDASAEKGNNLNKKVYWLFAIISVVLTFIAIYIANVKGPKSPVAPRTLPDIFRLVSTSGAPVLFIILLGVSSLILLTCYVCINKKTNGNTGLKSLNINIKFISILKYLVMAVAIVATCYISLLVTEYLFNQDFRFWQTSFTDMRVEHWGVAAAYALLFLPIFFVIGASINYTTRKDIPEWKDTLITIAINSLGVWLCCFVNIAMAYIAFSGKLFSPFTCSYTMLLYVPVSVFITRKLYKMTNSIWLGTFINALFLAWCLVSSTGFNDLYYAQGFFSVIFGR